MKLTIQIERLLDGRFKGYFVEIPAIYFVGECEGSVQERLGRLAHALESPNIRVERILPSGDVVLILDRGEETPSLSRRNGKAWTLSEAAEARA